MARLNSKIFVLIAATIAAMTANHAASAGRAQQAQATDYMLDNAMGEIALYPGDAYRSFVDSKYIVPSLEDLEQRVSRLPGNTRLHWQPYKREPSGKPILFSKGQYDRFAKFCRDHKIELIVLPSQPSNRKTL
jgi:hypothetical protein